MHLPGAIPTYLAAPGLQSTFRCIITHIEGYTMEELGNLIWLGDLISFRGPCKFQLLWGDMKIALQTYIFGFGAGDAQMQKAAKHMRAYANEASLRCSFAKARYALNNVHNTRCLLLTCIQYACQRHAPAVSIPTKQ
jgi:hypothetical protein